MTQSATMILASQSRYRLEILKAAGLSFTPHPSSIDERAIEESVGNDLLPEDLAVILAEAKATSVSMEESDALVLGCDQVLALGDDLLHKAQNMEDARRRLLLLSGQTHQLHSALCISRNGETLWTHVETAHMHMRVLSAPFIGRHLSRVGDSILGSVGCYQYEGEGIQLFEKVEGDIFTIIGLPLMPLLAQLRTMEAIDA